MTREDPIDSASESAHIPRQVKLAAAWTSFMFLYAYVDIFSFYKPGVIDDARAGVVFEFNISPTLLTMFIALMAVPALMVWLSMILPARMNRVTNLVVAGLYLPVTLFNAVGETLEWVPFYALSIGLEVLLLAFVLRCASTWRAAPSDATELTLAT